MKCLFIFPDGPLSQNYFDGGAARCTQAFQALVHLGYDVHVLRLLDSKKRDVVARFEMNLSEVDAKNYDEAKSWLDIPFEYRDRFRTYRDGIIKGVFSPIEFAFPHAMPLRDNIKTAIAEIMPDFILAEMMPAGAALASIKPSVPWIYGHHDWEYRVRQIRNSGLSKRMTLGRRFTNWVLRSAEEKVVKASSAVIAASVTEEAEIKQLGVKRCISIPATYSSVPVPPQAAPGAMRIIHLANLQRSVNTKALQSYITQVVPFLDPNWEFIIVGSISNAPQELLNHAREVGAKIEGFVPDLSTVLRPFDVAVVPYEHNTGERTRVAQLFNYAQVVVTTERAVKGSSYLRSGHNCLAVPSLADFPAALNYLAEQPELRKQIGLAAKATFEKELTLQAQLPKFQHIIESAVYGR